MKSLLISPISTLLLILFGFPAWAENLEHTQQLLNSRICSECDLSRAGLVYANLTNTDLTQANLQQANLSRANLSGANLSGANLSGAILFNANLTNANLSGADLRGADLRGAVLSGATFQGARIEGVQYLGAVGLPPELATAVNLYNLGLVEAERGNYRGAIEQYNQVLQLEPNAASAYLARSISLLHLGDRVAALNDAQRAQQLYQSQGNQAGEQAAIQVTEGIEAVEEALEDQRQEMTGNGLGTGFLNLLGSVAGLLLQFGLP